MLAEQHTPSKPFIAIVLSCLLLAIGLSVAPALAGASDAADDQVFTADLVVPAWAGEEQWCVAYGLASGGTPPYTYAWGGLYDGLTGRVVGTNIPAGGGNVSLVVTDSLDNQATAPVYGVETDIRDNEDCDA